MRILKSLLQVIHNYTHAKSSCHSESTSQSFSRTQINEAGRSYIAWYAHYSLRTNPVYPFLSSHLDALRSISIERL